MYCLWCQREILAEVNWGNLFYPDSLQHLCGQCMAKLEPLIGKQCALCSRLTDNNKVCMDCERWESDPDWQGTLVFNKSVFLYNEAIQEMVVKWKYRGDYILREVFRTAFGKKFLETFSLWNDIVVVPIPLSKERLAERGFNQAESLASLVETPMHHALARVNGEKQSKKTRRERLASMNPFEVTMEVKKTIVLIDDIYTTGVTLRHAAKKLKESGCPAVYSFTLIRG
jgi:competence protein ComFC